MPTLNATGPSSEVDLNDIVCQFAFTLQDHSAVHAYIGSPKFEKHILPVDFDPAVHSRKETTKDWGALGVLGTYKGKHTAIAPASFGTIRPLYELFARDFVSEFRKNGGKASYMELKYKKEEVSSYLSRGINAKNNLKDAYAFHFLRVGAVVKNLAAGQVRQSPGVDPIKAGTILIVYFQHGPLVE